MNDTNSPTSDFVSNMLKVLNKAAQSGDLDVPVGDQKITFSQMNHSISDHVIECPEGSVQIDQMCGK